MCWHLWYDINSVSIHPVIWAGNEKMRTGILWLVVTQYSVYRCIATLQWRHKGCNSVSNHQPHECLLNRVFRHRSKKTSKLRVTGLCVGNSPGNGEFPAQMASNAGNVSIWWRHHERPLCRRTGDFFHCTLVFFSDANMISHYVV